MAALTCDAMDGILLSMERAMNGVDRAQGSLVKLPLEELNLLRHLGAARDFMMAVLQGGSNHRGALLSLFGGDCARISRVRAILELMVLSDGARDDQRVATCLQACQCIESVIEDLGLGAALRRAQEAQKNALLRQREEVVAAVVPDVIDAVDTILASCEHVDVTKVDLAESDTFCTNLVEIAHQPTVASNEPPFEHQLNQRWPELPSATEVHLSDFGETEAKEVQIAKIAREWGADKTEQGFGYCSGADATSEPSPEPAAVDAVLSERAVEPMFDISTSTSLSDALTLEDTASSNGVLPEPAEEPAQEPSLDSTGPVSIEHVSLDLPPAPHYTEQTCSRPEEDGQRLQTSECPQDSAATALRRALAGSFRADAARRRRPSTGPPGHREVARRDQAESSPSKPSDSQVRPPLYDLKVLSDEHWRLLRRLFSYYVGPAGMQAGTGLGISKFRRFVQDCGLLAESNLLDAFDASSDGTGGDGVSPAHTPAPRQGPLSLPVQLLPVTRTEADLVLSQAAGSASIGGSVRSSGDGVTRSTSKVMTVEAYALAIADLAVRSVPTDVLSSIGATSDPCVVFCDGVLTPLADRLLRGSPDVLEAGELLAGYSGRGRGDAEVVALLRRGQRGLEAVFARYARRRAASTSLTRSGASGGVCGSSALSSEYYRQGYLTPSALSRFASEAGVAAGFSHTALHELFGDCVAFEAGCGRGEEGKMSYSGFLLALMVIALRTRTAGRNSPVQYLGALLIRIGTLPCAGDLASLALKAMRPQGQRATPSRQRGSKSLPRRGSV